MTTPLIVQPDLEAWVWSQVGHLDGVTSFTYAAAQQDRAGWIMANFVQIDARRASKAAARETAERVRQIITGLADVPWAEGCVCYVHPVEGPAWLPDDDGSPRYMARFEIRVHPPRSAPAAAGT